MIIKTPIPINCVDCDNRGIRGIVDCKLIYSGCANCGRHPNCPLKDDSDVEDCIDRKCVLDKIQRLINAEQNNIDEHGDYMNYDRERVNAYEAIQFFVENDCLCPSVTPQPRKGHWVLTDVEGDRVWHCCCSECGKDPQDYIGGSENWWLIKTKLPKFCPHCGADMSEVEG